MWIYIIAATALYFLFDYLLRLPTVGKYGERHVFITGCDTGFGNLLAKRLDSLGFHVFGSCYSEKGADELRKGTSSRMNTMLLDVSKVQSIEKAKEFVIKNLPPGKGLWAIVNNAGIVGHAAPSEWYTRADYESCLAVNTYGVIDVTRIFLPLVRQGRGRVVNIASIMGRIASGSAPYCISKYAVEAFSDCLRREVLKQGISVHILEPGYFKTDLLNVDNIKISFRKMYAQASPEVQTYYGSDFVDKVVENVDVQLTKMASPKVHLVVDAYTHAITAMFPRYRYLVGNDAKYLFRLLWNLPEWIQDKIVTAGQVLPAGIRK